jgi:hypothetical protein
MFWFLYVTLIYCMTIKKTQLFIIHFTNFYAHTLLTTDIIDIYLFILLDAADISYCDKIIYGPTNPNSISNNQFCTGG